jgi:hypothetical protein
MSIKYQVRHHESCKNGKLLNLSQQGALICVPEKLKSKTSITLIIEPDKTTPGKPIRVDAIIVRDSSSISTRSGGYLIGCYIVGISDPN